jgi:hypothetical protein
MKFTRDIAIGVLGVMVAGLMIRLFSDPYKIEANSRRIERLEAIVDQQERRLVREEMRHDPAIEQAPTARRGPTLKRFFFAPDISPR